MFTRENTQKIKESFTRILFAINFCALIHSSWWKFIPCSSISNPQKGHSLFLICFGCLVPFVFFATGGSGAGFRGLPFLPIEKSNTILSGPVESWEEDWVKAGDWRRRLWVWCRAEHGSVFNQEPNRTIDKKNRHGSIFSWNQEPKKTEQKRTKVL